MVVFYKDNEYAEYSKITKEILDHHSGFEAAVFKPEFDSKQIPIVEYEGKTEIIHYEEAEDFSKLLNPPTDEQKQDAMVLIRKFLYESFVDPLMNEARMERLQGDTTKANEKEAEALAKYNEIKEQYQKVIADEIVETSWWRFW